jgi:hypothetical protein
MSSTFSNLKFELIGTGEQSGTWGSTTNTNIGTAVEQAIVGMATLTSSDFTANVATLTLSNTNAAQNARALCLNIAAGAVSAAGTINVPAIQKPYVIINGSSYTVTVKVTGLTGVAVPAGKRLIVYNNGTDVSVQTDYLPSLTLGTALPIASGGTGATTDSAARTNFGATTLGANLFTISNPSAITFPQFNADNTVSSLSASAFRTAIGAGTGGGSVSSVGGTGTVNGITLTGTVTSSGNLTLGGTLSGVSLTTQVTGTLPIANGGTGSTSTTYVDLTANVTGALPIANGGSAATTASAARTNFGATTLGSNIFTISNPSAITFPQFNADNTVSALSALAFRTAIGAGSGGGSVTSVAGTGTVSGLTLSGTVTSSGNLTLGGSLKQNVSVVGSNTTAVSSYTYVMTADMTLTLPATPSAGDWVNVVNVSGATTPVIGRNSSNIMSSASDLTFDVNNTGVTLIYTDATRGWVLLP